jgi:general secretion pathway protein D
MPIPHPCRALGVFLAVLSLAACQTFPTSPGDRPWPTIPHQVGSSVTQPPEPNAAAAADPYRVYKGTGIVVKGQAQGGGVPPRPPVQVTGGAVVLNFEGADLREVVRNILGDILNESYTIDPAVGGQVTIRTTTGIPREALHATLETLLRMNGATMLKEGNIYKIVPQATAVRGNVTPQLGGSQRALPQGFSVQIVPLRYVGVRDMLRILEPFARDAQAIRGDELRNLVILSGTERELKHLLDTIDMFDIDWMAGMSVGVFVLQSAEVKSVMAELDKITGPAQQSPLAGILRIVPIERMNALLVITPQPAYLEEAKKWIERLDRGGGDSPRLYIFALQNSRAEKVAPLLQQAFSGRAQQTTLPPAPTLAPGTPAGTIVSPPAFTPQPPGAPPVAPVAAAAAAVGAAAGVAAAQRAGDAPGIVRNLQAVADKDNNTIIIVATPAEYSIIESALRKLDTPARQVIIEMTIAEVLLTDELQFGVEFLFRGASPSGRGVGGNVFSPVTAPAGGAINLGSAIGNTLASGFTYLITNSNFPGGIAAALRMLDSYGNAKVIANPHLAAIDNQKATIKVGTRIPINTTTFLPGTVNTSNVTSVAQYIDTGVLVQITPHINAGGLVTLDVQAEVSNPGIAARVGDAPPINTRSVQTMIAVPSGATMVMGGLIQDTSTFDTDGLPLISRIPVIGGLFGNQAMKKNRNELVLFVTPRLLESEGDVRTIVEDLRRRMERLDKAFPGRTDAIVDIPTLIIPPLEVPAFPTLRPSALRPGVAPR